MRKLYIIIGLTLILGCNKDKIRIFSSLNAEIVIDSMVYQDNRVEMYYKLTIDEVNPTFEIKWISPSENKGYGPFHTNLLNSYVFKVEICDSRNNFDTIKNSYDKRDKLVGIYYCIYRKNFHESPNTCSISNPIIDTLSVCVSKLGNNELKVHGESPFKVDSGWYYSIYYEGYHRYYGNDYKFYPKKDSISFTHYYDTPSCGSYAEYYNGVK